MFEKGWPVLPKHKISLTGLFCSLGVVVEDKIFSCGGLLSGKSTVNIKHMQSGLPDRALQKETCAKLPQRE